MIEKLESRTTTHHRSLRERERRLFGSSFFFFPLCFCLLRLTCRCIPSEARTVRLPGDLYADFLPWFLFPPLVYFPPCRSSFLGCAAMIECLWMIFLMRHGAEQQQQPAATKNFPATRRRVGVFFFLASLVSFKTSIPILPLSFSASCSEWVNRDPYEIACRHTRRRFSLS
jgi:hypothetical protein